MIYFVKTYSRKWKGRSYFRPHICLFFLYPKPKQEFKILPSEILCNIHSCFLLVPDSSQVGTPLQYFPIDINSFKYKHTSVAIIPLGKKVQQFPITHHLSAKHCKVRFPAHFSKETHPPEKPQPQKASVMHHAAVVALRST